MYVNELQKEKTFLLSVDLLERNVRIKNSSQKDMGKLGDGIINS